MILGMNQLRLGQFAAGWANYAARDAILVQSGRELPTFGEPWTGDDLAGKTVLIADDQGHGDAIHFFRYLPMLRQRRAARITWRTFPTLVRLLADAAPDIEVVAALPDWARFDRTVTSTSLPRLFGTEMHSIPEAGAYLHAPSKPHGSGRLPAEGRPGIGVPAEGRPGIGLSAEGRPRIGLVWSGDARHLRDHLRSIPADRFLTLADSPDFAFHSLQHPVRASDVAALLRRPHIDRSVETAADFADTAAIIAGLDLVIAVDTAVAHLAAAMGKPVWLLLHVAPDWRWLAERADSPWYQTMRLFRVRPEEWSSDGGWGPMLGRVKAALKAFRPAARQAAGTMRPRGRPAKR
jgi:hypothetical protein